MSGVWALVLYRIECDSESEALPAAAMYPSQQERAVITDPFGNNRYTVFRYPK